MVGVKLVFSFRVKGSKIIRNVFQISKMEISDVGTRAFFACARYARFYS